MLLFWLAEAICYLTKEIERNEYNQEWADFCEKLITRINNDYYQCGSVSFEPSLGKVQKYMLRKVGVPEIFISGVIAVNKCT